MSDVFLDLADQQIAAPRKARLSAGGFFTPPILGRPAPFVPFARAPAGELVQICIALATLW